MLTCGPRLIDTSVPNEQGEDGESCLDDDESSEDAENNTVCATGQHNIFLLFSKIVLSFHHLQG